MTGPFRAIRYGPNAWNAPPMSSLADCFTVADKVMLAKWARVAERGGRFRLMSVPWGSDYLDIAKEGGDSAAYRLTKTPSGFVLSDRVTGRSQTAPGMWLLLQEMHLTPYGARRRAKGER